MTEIGRMETRDEILAQRNGLLQTVTDQRKTIRRLLCALCLLALIFGGTIWVAFAALMHGVR